MPDVSLIRNIAIFGHGKCGKTSLAEAMLFTAGSTTRLGKVDAGNSVLDYEPEEVARKLTIGSSFHRYTWKKHQTYLIDTPGDDNFLNDARYAAAVTDGALFVIGAAQGVKFQTERVAAYVAEHELPAIIFVTKMDRERASFAKVVEGIKESLPFNGVPLHLPIGAEADFRGVVDLVSQKAYEFEPETGKAKEIDIPSDMADEVAVARESLMEQVAETDDDLIERFLEEGALTEEELRQGLVAAVRKGQVHPILAGVGVANRGTELLLDAINAYLPDPSQRPARMGVHPESGEPVELAPKPDAPFSALVFKTITDPYAGQMTVFKILSGTLSGDSFYNATKQATERFGQALVLEGKEQKPVKEAVCGMVVAVAKLKETVTGDTLCTPEAPVVYELPPPIEPVVSYAVKAKSKDDEEKLFAALARMTEEDPTLRLERSKQTKETLLSGVGQLHLTVTGEKIKRKFGVEMELAKPKVPYLETIKAKATAQGRHKKQTGGRGQYGDAWIEIEPLPRGGGFVFEDRIVGGVIPRQYIPAVEKGIQETMENGVVAGYPMVDVKVALFDGSYHTVDSSEMAFKIAGSLAFKNAVQQANPVLLEPIMEMKIWVPKECVGDVIGDLNGRRGRVMGMDSEEKVEVITAQVPMAEVLEYAPDLTSITGGRGRFTMKLSHYEELPAQLAEQVIAAAKEDG
ncbi:MAG TPA: elongation factor G [Desulfobacterales bacterium]|nr:elongation factor G [Desulfobacterales bacterium]